MDPKEKESPEPNVVKALNKKFGKCVIGPASEIMKLEIPRKSTGSISVDIETGGGFPCGRLVEIYGRESSGKTYISLKTVAEDQKTSTKKCLWIDAEGAFDKEWSKVLGVDLTKLDLASPDTLEEAGTILDAVVRANTYSIVVLDSVAALLPQEDLDKAMDAPERIGNRAMLMNRIVRKLHSALNVKEEGKQNDTLVIFINQIRENIGVVYGNPDDTPGGLGIRFAASIRLEMRRSDLIKEKPKQGDTGVTPDGNIITGFTVKFKTAKNKTFTPLKTGQYNLYTDGERKGKIDRVDEVVRYGIIAGSIKQNGPSYTYNDHKFLGKQAVIDHFREHPEEVEKVFEEVKKVFL